uniref:Right handed beta helix domain-containing protein n=1 Tax=Eutreptiella gymnastica TaxID=73025 RepID=A0A7S4CWB4_9EUGL
MNSIFAFLFFWVLITTCVPVDDSDNLVPHTPLAREKVNIATDITASLVLRQDHFIPSQAHITVHGGVTITLAHDVSLTIEGAVHFAGNLQNPINIVGEGANGAQGGVVLDKAGSCDLEHVTIQHIGQKTAAFQVVGKESSVKFRNVTFTKIPGDALVVHAGQLKEFVNNTFKDVVGACLHLHGDLHNVHVRGSMFDNCSDHALSAIRLSKSLFISDTTFKNNGKYTINLETPPSFEIRSNRFVNNQGVLSCKRHAITAAIVDPKLNDYVFAENDLNGNVVDYSSDPWSRGNVIYIHGCTMIIANNTLKKMDRGPHLLKFSSSSMINFFDAHIHMERNTILENWGFQFIVNVGGSLSRVVILRNIFANRNITSSTPSTPNYEVVNEAMEAEVDARMNWWGCSLPEDVGKRILDFVDGGEKYGVIEYWPFLTEANMKQEVTDLGDDVVESPVDQPDSPAKQINKGEIIGQDEEWHGERILNGNVWINKGVILTLRAKTHIRMARDTNIHVDGTLSFEGTEQEPVQFSPIGGCKVESIHKMDHWGDITFSASSGLTIIKNANFCGGGAAPMLNGKMQPLTTAMLKFEGASAFLTNVRVTGSASSGIIATAGNLTVINNAFYHNRGNAIVHSAPGPLTVNSSLLKDTRSFTIVIIQSEYTIAGNTFGLNNGILCVHHQRLEWFKEMIDLAGPTSLFINNMVTGNQHAFASECWGDNSQELLLMDLADKRVNIEGNMFSDNKCESRMVRRQYAMYFLIANNAASFSENYVNSNYGSISMERKETKVASWDHEPQVFRFESNRFTDNQFLQIYLRIPGRRALVVNNIIRDNEVTDVSKLQETAILEIVGGSFTLKPMILTKNQILGNEGTLLAVRLHDNTKALGNWFCNPVIKYELAFKNLDPTLFTGINNYWGMFGEEDERLVMARLKPVNGHVPRRWYMHWITRTGDAANVKRTTPPIPPQDKQTAVTVVSLGMAIMFVLAMCILVRHCAQGPFYGRMEFNSDVTMQTVSQIMSPGKDGKLNKTGTVIRQYDSRSPTGRTDIQGGIDATTADSPNSSGTPHSRPRPQSLSLSTSVAKGRMDYREGGEGSSPEQGMASPCSGSRGAGDGKPLRKPRSLKQAED